MKRNILYTKRGRRLTRTIKNNELRVDIMCKCQVIMRIKCVWKWYTIMLLSIQRRMMR